MLRGGRQRPRPSNGTEEPRGSAVPRCFLGARLHAEPCPHRSGSRSTGELAAGEDTQSEDPLGVTAPLGIKPPGSWEKPIATGPVQASPSLSRQAAPPPCAPGRAGRRVLLRAVPSERPEKGSPCAAQQRSLSPPWWQTASVPGEKPVATLSHPPRQTTPLAPA